MRPSKWKLFDMDESPPPSSPDSVSSPEHVSVGLRRPWKYSFHCPNTCSVEVSSTSYTVWVKHYFSLLSCLVVYQNNFKANQKSCSITLPSSSHTRVFVWAIARTALHLACQCLPAPSRVLQTIRAPIQPLLQLDGSRHLQQPLSDLKWDHDRRRCRTCWKWEPNTLLTGPLPDEASTPSLYVWMHQAFPSPHEPTHH